MVLFKKLFKGEKVVEDNALDILKEGYANPNFEKAVKVAAESFKINKTIVDNDRYVEFEHGSNRIVKLSYQEVVEILGYEPSYFKRSAK